MAKAPRESDESKAPASKKRAARSSTTKRAAPRRKKAASKAKTKSSASDTAKERIAASKPFPPLVGRRAVLDDLLLRCQSLRDRRASGVPRPVVLVGEHGVGLSRLLDECRRKATDDGARVFLARPPERTGGERDPLGSLEGALRSLGRLESLRSHALHSGRGVLSATTARAAARVLAGREMRGLSLSRASERVRLERGIAELFAASAQKRPLVLLVDEAESLDPVSLETVIVLARIATAGGSIEPPKGAPLFLVIATHDAAAPALQPLLDGTLADRIDVPALEDPEARALLDVLELPTEGVDALIGVASGSALHLVQGGRALVEGGSSEAVATLEGSFEARVAALEDGDAAILQALARAGRPMPVPALVETLELWRRPDAEPLEVGGEEPLRNALRDLAALGLCTPVPLDQDGEEDSDGWVIGHRILAEKLLEAISTKSRRSLAGALALGIERWAGRRAEARVIIEEEAKRGGRPETARSPRRAVMESARIKVRPFPGEDERDATIRAARRAALGPWWALLTELRAEVGAEGDDVPARAALANRAFARHDDEVATRHLGVIAELDRALLPDGWRTWKVLERLGIAAAAAGRDEEAIGHFEKAKAQLGLDEEGDALPRICRQAARIEAGRGNLDRARKLISEARTALDSAGPDASPAERGAVLALSGHVALRRNEREAARRHLRRGITVAEATSDRDLAATCLSDLGQVQWLRGEVNAARRFFERVLRLREELGDIAGHAEALLANGRFRAAVGEGTTGAGLLRRARKAFEALGLARDAARALREESLAHRAVSDWGGALTGLERAGRRSAENDDGIGVVRALTSQARLLADLGRVEDAREVLGRARGNDIDPAASPEAAIALYRALARLEAARGEWTSAATRLAEAARLAEGAAEMPLLASVLLELAKARLSGHRGSVPAADRDKAREALERAEEIGARLGLRRIRGHALLLRAEAGGGLGRGGRARLRIDVEEAVAVSLEINDRDLEARSRLRFAEILEGRGERQEAKAQRGAARAAIGEIALTLSEAGRDAFKRFRESDLKGTGDESSGLSAVVSEDRRGFESFDAAILAASGDHEHDDLEESGDAIALGNTIGASSAELPAVGEVGGPGASAADLAATRKRRAPLESERLLRLLDINKALNAELELDRLLDMIMDAAIALSGAKRGFIVLWEQGEPKLARSRNVNRLPVDSPEAALSRGLIREAVEGRKTVVTACAREERAGYASTSGLDLKSVVVCPLISKAKVIGAIYLDEPIRAGAFEDEDVYTVEAFSEQAALALENARLHDELAARMETTTRELRRAEEELRRQRSEAQRRYRHGNIIGVSDVMQNVYKILDRAKDSTFPIIVQGESGTGKELVAKFIHFNGPRREKPFVAENCAALPETLLDSELFGYVKGAFTGAMDDKKGLFELANSGSLFLDEIEEMSPAMQRKLLRVLQEGEVRPIGARSTRRVDVRVICATNRDIATLLELGEFRRDLYYRLNVIRMQLPPLRDRREDIPLLVDHQLEEMSKNDGVTYTVKPEAMRLLCAYPWPGNVRELQNELKRLAALGVHDVGVEDLSQQVREPERLVFPNEPLQRAGSSDGGVSMPAGGAPTLPDVPLREVERMMIRQSLERCNNNKTKAAKQLGLSRRGLLKKLARYGPDGP